MIAIMFEWYILVLWYLLWIVLLGLIAYDFVKVHLKIRKARKQGLYPSVDQEPTLDDVKRLVAAGERMLAMKLYSDLNDVGDKEAHDAVAKIKAEFQAEIRPLAGVETSYDSKPGAQPGASGATGKVPPLEN
jgi:hypothetical protein